MAEALNQRVAAEVNQIIKLGAYLERPETATLLREEAQLWRAKETSLVVAAEPNRGKSSLINALLGSDVLPVGTEIATTATHVVIRYGDEARARVHLVGRSEPLELPVAEAGRWICGLDDESIGIRGVELTQDHPLLAAGLAVVDTPGVGGLDASHGRITLTALRRADAMLFVIDAGAPLSDHELGFLSQAAERIEVVIFCVTKVDRFRGWREVVDDNRKLLSARAPRFAGSPILPVSSRLMAMAQRTEGAEGPDVELARESGIPELEELIRTTILSRVALLRLANLLRVAGATLDSLSSGLEATLQAATDGSTAAQSAEQCQTALDVLRDSAEWAQLTIVDRCNALREGLQTDLNRATKEITAGFDQPTGKNVDPAVLVEELTADLLAADAAISERIDQEMEVIRELVENRISDPTFSLPTVERLDGSSFDFGQIEADETPAKDPMGKLRAASAVASTGAGAAMLARFATVPGSEGIAIAMGASVLFGAVTAVANLRSMRKQRDQAQARRQVQAIVEQARTEASPRLRQRILDLQRATEAEVKAYHRRRTKELQDQMAEATRLARADASARDKARVETQQRLDLVDRHRVVVATMAAEVQRFAGIAAAG